MKVLSYAEDVQCANGYQAKKIVEKSCTAIMYQWKMNGYSQDPGCLTPHLMYEHVQSSNVYFAACNHIM